MVDYADAIKSSVTMNDVCNRYGIEVNRVHKARCPFHSDSKPSMHIYNGKKGWFCYVCNQGGSCIDFVMQLFNLNFHDAIRKMNDDFSLGLDLDGEFSEEQQREANRIAYKRRMEQKRRQDAQKRLLTAYSAAYDKYSALDIIMLWDAPDGPYDEVSPYYEYACKHIDAAWEDVQEAAARLREFEKKGE